VTCGTIQLINFEPKKIGKKRISSIQSPNQTCLGSHDTDKPENKVSTLPKKRKKKINKRHRIKTDRMRESGKLSVYLHLWSVFFLFILRNHVMSVCQDACMNVKRTPTVPCNGLVDSPHRFSVSSGVFLCSNNN
jgi:hypothetical protein